MGRIQVGVVSGVIHGIGISRAQQSEHQRHRHIIQNRNSMLSFSLPWEASASMNTVNFITHHIAVCLGKQPSVHLKTSSTVSLESSQYQHTFKLNTRCLPRESSSTLTSIFTRCGLPEKATINVNHQNHSSSSPWASRDENMTHQHLASAAVARREQIEFIEVFDNQKLAQRTRNPKHSSHATTHSAHRLSNHTLRITSSNSLSNQTISQSRNTSITLYSLKLSKPQTSKAIQQHWTLTEQN